MNHKPTNLYRLQRDKIIAGVASGFGLYLGVHPAWVRLALLLLVFGGVAIPQVSVALLIAYIIMAVVVPVVPGNQEPSPSPLFAQLKRNQNKKMLAGICAGLADAAKIPVWLLRVVFVLLGFTGVSVVAYVVLLLVMG